MSNFCQFKVGYLLDSGFDNLTAILLESDGSIFDIVHDAELPEGWELKETTISGCTGCVLIFETYNLPLQSDMDAIDAYIKALERSITP